MDPSLLGTDLGPQGQAIIDSDKGGCKLIALTCSFPKSRESLEEIADLWLPLVVLDDWLEQQSASEATEYAEWQKALWRMRYG